jgi:hypothetical protein
MCKAMQVTRKIKYDSQIALGVIISFWTQTNQCLP